MLNSLNSIIIKVAFCFFYEQLKQQVRNYTTDSSYKKLITYQFLTIVIRFW